MRCFIHSSIGLLTLLAAVGSTAGGPQEEMRGDARVARHWLPEACVLALDVEHALQAGGEESAATDEARWNRLYRFGIEAVETGDLEQARTDFCQALEAAGSFGPRDIRFAETLDELGLVGFLSEDYAVSETMQGAAIAEMLLALGPPSGDLAKTAKRNRRSSVATYMVRLGWIFERQGLEGEIESLLKEPHLILDRGYVPIDSVLRRLDGLISQYLLVEDFAAADWLSALRDEVR